MKQLIEDRYIGVKVGDTIGVVDRRGFIAPDGGGGDIHKASILLKMEIVEPNLLISIEEAQ